MTLTPASRWPSWRKAGNSDPNLPRGGIGNADDVQIQVPDSAVSSISNTRPVIQWTTADGILMKVLMHAPPPDLLGERGD